MTKKDKKPEMKPATVEVVESNRTYQHEDLFVIVEQNGQFRIAVTNKIISNKVFGSLKEATNYIDSKPWELIVNVSCAIWDIIQKENLNK